MAVKTERERQKKQQLLITEYFSVVTLYGKPVIQHTPFH